MTKKKYILKPGKHQFAPKSPPIHDNDSLSDDEAEWYLQKYPHIKSLFVANPGSVESPIESVESLTQIGVIENNNENLPTTN
ncbi:MAG: hypothetical protein JO080_01120 [Mucilaginibacter sp.]|nr:hypothetical protein [Mucilaginibacter sp.]